MEHLSARQHVIDMCRTMLERGYLKATEGNVSVRVPGRRLYAVTPSNYSYDRMRVEDVCIVDFDGKHVPDDDRAGASLAPSIECGMHANIYRARPDVHAIVHTHQPYASALAVLRRPIPALTDEQVRFLGREVAIIDYAPSGTGFLAKNVQKKITSGDNAFILANHGIVAVGTDPERAVFNMALLEKVSIAYLLALTTESGKVYTIPTPIREIAFAKLRSDEKRIAAQITKSVPAQRVPDAVPLPSADAAASAVVAEREAFAVAEPVAPAEAPGAESARLGYAISSYPDVEDTMDAPARPGRPAGARPAARRPQRRARVVRDQVPGQQAAHRPGEVAHPGRRAAQPRLQPPVPPRHRPRRRRPPHRPRRQRLHRLPPGRRADPARQQLRARSTSGSPRSCASRAR